jgi:hypothetical protein
VGAPSSVRCFALLVAVKAALLLLGFGRTHRLVMRLSSGKPAAVAGSFPIVSATADRVAMAAAFFPGRALCLEQSLSLYLLLRRMGIQADLRFGVQAYPFAAHAWVEHGGEAVNESAELIRHFAALPGVFRWVP